MLVHDRSVEGKDITHQHPSSDQWERGGSPDARERCEADRREASMRTGRNDP